jgi:hypothetical protein
VVQLEVVNCSVVCAGGIFAARVEDRETFRSSHAGDA